MAELLSAAAREDTETLKESYEANKLSSETQGCPRPTDQGDSPAMAIGSVDSDPRFASLRISVQDLPEELFIHIVQSYVNPWTPMQDLIRTTLVCQRWRTTVEGTPSLWTRISGNESLLSIRRGLGLSGQSPLDVIYNEDTSKVGPTTFFQEIGGHIARWRSLVAEFKRKDISLSALETSPAPALEKLHLVCNSRSYWKKAPLTLFGGARAPSTLKDFRVNGFPIALSPLRLVQLRRFKLGSLTSVTAGAVIRALQELPELEELELRSLEDGNDPYPNDGPIQLPFLHRVYIFAIPIQMAQTVLSNIFAPNLRQLQVTLNIRENPRTAILPAFSHLIPAMKSVAFGASVIDVDFDGYWYGVKIGELSLSFQSGADNGGALAQELFDWLVGQLGERLADLPVTLSLYDCPSNPLYAEWLSSRVKVTKLSLWHEPYFGQMSDDVVSSLSEPDASSSTGWLLPHLETLDTNLTWEGGNWDLVDMIRVRQSAAIRGDQGETGITAPRPFREVWMSYGGKKANRKQPPEVDFMQAVQDAARDADVYWCDVKWG